MDHVVSVDAQPSCTIDTDKSIVVQMQDWTLEIHRETGGGVVDADSLDTYLNSLADVHAAISFTPQGRLSARFAVPASDPAGAAVNAIRVEEAATVAAGIGGDVTAIVLADARTPDGEATWIRTPLLSLTDIGKLLGVSRQRASQLANNHPLFPAPAARPSTGPLFEAAAVSAFRDSWARKSGRPTRQAANS